MKHLIIAAIWLLSTSHFARAGTLLCSCPAAPGAPLTTGGSGIFGGFGGFAGSITSELGAWAKGFDCGASPTPPPQYPNGTQLICVTDNRTIFANSGFGSGTVQYSDVYNSPQSWIVLIPGTQAGVITQKNNIYGIDTYAVTLHQLGCHWMATPTGGAPFGIGGAGSTAGGYCQIQAKIQIQGTGQSNSVARRRVQ
jgi:hypothetical protein